LFRPLGHCFMGLTLIEAAKYENRLEHLAVPPCISKEATRGCN